MNYMDMALRQLAFALKLRRYGESGSIDLKEINAPLTTPDKVQLRSLEFALLSNEGDLIAALNAQVQIAFGAAAITLDRCREEAPFDVQNVIQSDEGQFAALTRQIRNAFAHDISEPRWDVRIPGHARVYDFGGVRADLTKVNGDVFSYDDIGGPGALFRLADYGADRIWPGKASHWIRHDEAMG
jgi:hypothetical protein